MGIRGPAFLGREGTVGLGLTGEHEIGPHGIPPTEDKLLRGGSMEETVFGFDELGNWGEGMLWIKME